MARRLFRHPARDLSHVQRRFCVNRWGGLIWHSDLIGSVIINGARAARGHFPSAVRRCFSPPFAALLALMTLSFLFRH